MICLTHDFLVLGINHNTAPVLIREKVSFPGNHDGSITRFLTQTGDLLECIILSTCNRSEIIAVTKDPDSSVENLIRLISEIHGLNQDQIGPYFYIKKGQEAVRHLFRVTSSLDSMVLGEPQIVGQVKEAFRRDASANTTGPLLNRLMHRAFFTAKRVRTETGVALSAVSIAYVAVELAKKILGELEQRRTLLVGAGEMAELTARHLASLVKKPIKIINRTFENACELASQFEGTADSMEKLDDALAMADMVISSTGSCEPIIRFQQMKTVMRRRRHKPIFMIDIAMPRDIEPEVNDLDGVYLYNIDDLQSVVDENMGERRLEAEKAGRIVDQEVNKFINWTRSLEWAPTIVSLKEKFEEIRTNEMAKMNGKLGSLNEAEKDAVEILTKAIINKIAHGPIAFMKQSVKTKKINQHVDFVQRVFGLDEFVSGNEPEEAKTSEYEIDHRN
ncbi:MAG: glutamyl-tRNA reductase [Deltaproteobacteria bacterium]|nr:glutamyl-tRNA reductase [Deltaproteobacteria bacterium]